MRIRLSTVVHLIPVLGQREVDYEIREGCTVGELMQVLAANCKDEHAALLFVDRALGMPHPHIRVMVNGRSITFLRGMDTMLTEDDQVLLLPMLGGG
jgi:molybdopterin converting factor small subunit